MIAFSPLELQFLEALGIIALACLFVPISKRLGFGSVIGYIASGVAAGGALSLRFSEHPQELLHFAEFGIVLFLFVIGLEFRPARLWRMRRAIFGRGLTQVTLAGLALTAAPLVMGLDWRAALVMGLGLALSSTALVIQTLDEKGERNAAHGQAAIAILLFEDLAIVPLLLLAQLLSPAAAADGGDWDNAKSVAIAIAAIALLIAVGRFVLNPMFRLLAEARVPEIMTASALGVVIAAALLMDAVGMSYAMGAFIAGVMLAGSYYRHEVEADIEPFRGLFLGLFFVAVGLSLDLASVARHWTLVLVAVPLLVLIKVVVVYGVARLFRAGHAIAVKTAIAMSQHGEFGFVLFAAAAGTGLIDPETSSLLVAIVTLSMALSAMADRLIGFLPAKPKAAATGEAPQATPGATILVGFGRFGQMASQPLLAAGLPLTILDHDPDRIAEASVFGRKVYFGDGARRDILRAAGADSAQMIIVAVDDLKTVNAIVALAKREFGHARVLARAFDRVHAIALRRLGADVVIRETSESALLLGRQALTLHGLTETAADEAMSVTRTRDEDRLKAQMAQVRDLEDYAEIRKAIRPEPLSSKSDD